MAPKLSKSLQLQRLALDLGIKQFDNPVSAIIRYCERQVKRHLVDFPDCNDLSSLLRWLAGKLGTKFEEIYDDAELQTVKRKYLARREKIFARIEQELGPSVFGITYKLNNREGWEPPYVSVIDCRGLKGAKAYFTKWHELAHLLTLTDQLRLTFMRSHIPSQIESPEEALMEVIAGHFGFYPPIVQTYADEEISFDGIEKVRRLICPDASIQASTIGIVRAWPQACVLIEARPALKKNAERNARQEKLFHELTPVPELRAVHVTHNHAAQELDIPIFKNMRIPKTSVLYKLFQDNETCREAIEDLSCCETSSGGRPASRSLKVKTRRSWDSVQALVIPL
jgi:hypothetical protein